MAVALCAVAAGCSVGGPAGTPGGQRTVPAPQGRPGPASVSVTCHDDASDAAALQRAINTSPAGSTIQIGGPVCLLTSGIVLQPGRTYTGGSMAGTVLKQDGGMPFVLGSSSYAGNHSSTGGPLSIRDLTVACNGSGQTDGIVILNWLSDVEHVTVENCGGSGIVDTGSAANGKAITNTSVNSRFENNFLTNNAKYGFYVKDQQNSVTDGYLVDNQIAASGADAIHLEDAAGWTVTGNHLYDVGGSAIYASRLYGTTIAENYIEDFGSRQSSGTWYGIEATAQGGIGSTITANKVFNSGARGGVSYVYIGITQVNAGTSYLAVTGNVILGSGQGTGLSFAGGGNNLVVATSGNEVAGVRTPLSHTGSVRGSPGV